MSAPLIRLGAAGVLAAALVVCPSVTGQVRPDQQPDNQETDEGPPPVPDQEKAPRAGALQAGVEVQARGPVHEAYAQPNGSDPRPGPVVNKQPPDPVPETPPDQKPE